MIVNALVAAGLNHHVGKTEYPFEPVIEIFVFNAQKLGQDLQHRPQLISLGLIDAFQNLLRDLDGILPVTIAKMPDQLSKLLYIEARLGNVLVELLVLLVPEEEGEHAVFGQVQIFVETLC